MEWGKRLHQPQHCTESLIQWINLKDDTHILLDHFRISLTREDYVEFRKMDIEPMPNTRSSHTEPPNHNLRITNCPQHLQKGYKIDASPYPIFKNDLYYDTFQRSFLAVIKAQGFL